MFERVSSGPAMFERVSSGPEMFERDSSDQQCSRGPEKASSFKGLYQSPSTGLRHPSTTAVFSYAIGSRKQLTSSFLLVLEQW